MTRHYYLALCNLCHRLTALIIIIVVVVVLFQQQQTIFLFFLLLLLILLLLLLLCLLSFLFHLFLHHVLLTSLYRSRSRSRSPSPPLLNYSSSSSPCIQSSMSEFCRKVKPHLKTCIQTDISVHQSTRYLN